MFENDDLFLGRYRLLHPSEKDGEIETYKAIDARLNSRITIKIFHIENFVPKRRARFLKRFKQEVKKIARITHPNIVPIIDFGEYEGVPYLVMPNMFDETLQQHLNQKTLSWQQAIKLLIPIADALAYTHRKGIVHGDIKPSNILITASGAPMLAGYEIANFNALGLGTESSGYLAPEQFHGKGLEARSDVYSLGLIFFEMVMGHKPEQPVMPVASLSDFTRDPLTNLAHSGPELFEYIDLVIKKSLAEKPEERFQNMTELLRALKTISVSAEEMPNGDVSASTVNSITSLPDKKKSENKMGDQPDRGIKQRMRRWVLWIIGVVGFLLIAIVALNNFNSPATFIHDMLFGTPSPTATLTPTLTFTPTITLTPTQTLTPTASLTPTITPTPTRISISVENAVSVDFISSIDLPTFGRVVFSPDGEIMATGMEDSSVGLWQISEGTLLRTIGSHPNPNLRASVLAISPDGEMLASVYFDYRVSDNIIWLWRISDGTLLGKFEGHTNQINSISFSSDSQFIVSGGHDTTVRLWQVENKVLLRTWTENIVNTVAFSPNGQIIASGSDLGSIRLWSVANGDLLFKLIGNRYWVTSVAFSPDGQILASGHAGYKDDTIRLWRVSDGTLLRTLEGHTDVVESVAFSPNGQILASASRDGSTRLWRVSDGSLLRILGGSIDWWTPSVTFISDGKILAVGSLRTVKFYGITP